MLTSRERSRIREFLAQGLSVSQVSHETGRSVPTIYKLRRGNRERPIFGKGNFPPEKLKNFIDYLAKRSRQGISNQTKLLAEVRNQGYSGSYSTINRYLRDKLAQENRETRFNKRFETTPGDQAQVDWGSFGKIEINGKAERLYCFVFVLGYSRAIYIEFTIKQNLQTFEQCHIHAFEKLGVPHSILYDNVKTVVQRRERLPDDVKIHYNLAFLDFAQYYGFHPDLCPPYWPRTKGKVEAGVKYVRHDFMQGTRFNKGFKTLKDLNEQASNWVDAVANQRIHGTTGERPIDRWEKEKPHLRFVDDSPSYETSPFLERNSTKGGLVQYKSNWYTVPLEFSRRKLLVKEINKNGEMFLEIYHEDNLVITYKLATGRGILLMDDSLYSKPEKLKKKTLNTGTESKASKQIPEVVVAIRELNYYDQLIPRNNNGKES